MASVLLRRSPISVALVFLLLVFLALATQSGAVSSRRAEKRSDQISNCGDMATQRECAQSPSCRWCRSADLDDMCFSKPDALRLPQQVFSCLV